LFISLPKKEVFEIIFIKIGTKNNAKNKERTKEKNNKIK
jgi:hypothetical protein